MKFEVNNVTSSEKYKSYIISLIVDNMTAEEILTSSSDERYIYGIYFPEDIYFTNFEQVTKEIINDFEKLKGNGEGLII